MASTAQSARPRPAPVGVAPAAPAPIAETDADRRDRLNARLQEMIREGKGGRLSETPRARPAARVANRAPARQARPARRTTAAAPAPASTRVPTRDAARFETASTIAPPPVNPYRQPLARGRGYVAPRLDLTSAPRIPDNDIECLTQAIYYEARTESEEGQAAVAEVVLNRSRAGGYSRDVCQVVYQRNSRTCQFTFTCDGSIGRGPVNMAAWARAERIAREVHEGGKTSLLPKTSVNYHANYVRPSWGRRLERVRQIGAHIFYGAPLSGRTPGAEVAPPPPPPARLMFVRNEALDRAYALLQGGGTDGGA
jgi:spore germination cell wall hydrolase CwlJ-like protein